MTAHMSHVVVYDPVASLRTVKLGEAALLLDLSASMLRNKITNDDLYSEAFWKEGTHYRTSVGNLLKLQAQLGERHAQGALTA